MNQCACRFDGRLLLDDWRQFKKRRRYAAERAAMPAGSGCHGDNNSDEEDECERLRYEELPPPPHHVAIDLAALDPGHRAAARLALGDSAPVCVDDAADDDASGAAAEAEESATIPAATPAAAAAAPARDVMAPAVLDPGLELPAAGVPVPALQTQLELIVRTAQFVHAQGPQMAVLLRAKQAGSFKFLFLTPGTEMHPFFKHVLARLAAGCVFSNGLAALK
jgi:hypothetical protein